MKIATAAYPMDPMTGWAAFRDKLTDWVARAAGQGAELLVFPEYGAMELATLDGPDVAADLEASLHAVSRRMDDVDALHSELSTRHGVHILGGSAPVFDPALGSRPVNRASLFAPQGGIGVQDKQIMTRFERESWDVVPGGPLRLFETALGRIGVLICYDAEFPLLGRAMADADLLLVPSCTDTLAGYSRVRIASQARALEAQCVTVMASTVGDCDWSEAVDRNIGVGGVFGPPDTGFPETGIIAAGALNHPGWTFATVDPAAIAAVRADGGVLNRAHWHDQDGRADPPMPERLR